jgi:cysteine desulfurase
MSIYLDYNATTPPAREVVEAMVAALTVPLGNAASPHRSGRAAAARVERAREEVASLLGVRSRQVVWTSGATEALNTGLRAAASSVLGPVIAGAAEHKAVLDCVSVLQAEGQETCLAPVDGEGRVTVSSLSEVAPEGPFVLAVQAANNETGVLNDVPALAAFTHERGGLVVCDATQRVGKLPVSLSEWGVDYGAASAHKLYGPQGVGVLIVPPGAVPVPLLHGGGHERGWRSGTLNLPGIVGFGAAALLAEQRLAEHSETLRLLRDALEKLLVDRVGGVTVHAARADRLPNTTSVRLHGVDADALIVNCPEVAMASGSACTSSVPAPSHVLTAMGLSREAAEETIRLSVGAGIDEGAIDEAVELIELAVGRLRGLR